MNKVRTTFLMFFMLVLGWAPQYALGQIDDEYFAADQLLRQQKFEQAYERFNALHQKYPNTFIFFDKATESLINLKKYEKAISLSKQAVKDGFFPAQALTRLAEIHHLSGDSQKAFLLWNKVLKQYEDNQQVRLRVASALKERGFFDRAIDVYREVQKDNPSSNIVSSELGEAYLQAGRYEEAIREYLRLVKDNPERIHYVQRRLIRFQDDYIYDVAVLEISDFLDELSPRHPSYKNLQQLEVWLLMERKLFERALVTAKNYETQSSDVTYILYNLGPKLLAEQEFELAEQAYLFYIKKNIYPLQYRSKEELANVYIEWARYLENYNLGLSSKPEELYKKAFSTLESLHSQPSGYPRLGQVLATLAELSLDVLHDPEQASKYLSELRNQSGETTAQQTYLDGRLHLYRKDYTRARISFTKSNKQERIGSLAEKTRYYLALTDFFSGDYEFAKIQLNALERQNTSYFANDAVQLRLWIQNGLQADSTGEKLRPFAKAVEYFSRGNTQLGINKLVTLFRRDVMNPMVDEALLELSTNKEPHNATLVYHLLSNYLETQGAASPLYERLLWEKARLADQFVTNEHLSIPPSKASSDTLESFFYGTKEPISIPSNVETLLPIYEEILLNFPNGFYATYVRDRIRELQKIQS